MLESSLQSETVKVAGGPTGNAARATVLYAVVIAFLSVTPLAVLLPVVLWQAGRRVGQRNAWLALVPALAFAALFAAFKVSTAGAPPITYAYPCLMALGFALPAMLTLPMLLREQPFGRVLLVMLIASCAGLAATEFACRAVFGQSFYLAQLEAARQSAPAFSEIYVKMGTPQETAKRMAELAIYCVPGSLAVELAGLFFVNLFIAGRMSDWRGYLDGRDVGPTPYALHHLAFPDWLLFAFIFGGLSPLMKGMLQQIAANVLLVVFFLYLVQGLAIFRSILLTLRVSFGRQCFAWGSLVLLTVIGGVAPLLLSIAGLFDSFFDFRNFTKRKDDSDESDFD
jgi:hypothetical protein